MKDIKKMIEEKIKDVEANGLYTLKIVLHDGKLWIDDDEKVYVNSGHYMYPSNRPANDKEIARLINNVLKEEQISIEIKSKKTPEDFKGWWDEGDKRYWISEITYCNE